MNNRQATRYPALGYMGLILILSSIPGTTLTPVFELTPDKLIHLLEYWGLGFLVLRWLWVEFPQWTTQQLYRNVILFGMVFALMDELWQGIIPGRFRDPLDWIADSTGIIISVIVFHYSAKFGIFASWIRPNRSSVK